MTEQEFAAIRERWANVDDPPMALIDVALDDILALIRAVEERDAIIHDLMVDASTLTRRAVEEFAAGWVDRLADHARGVAKRTSATNYGKWLGLQYAINLVSALTKLGNIDPLPPDRVRQENERLRERLKVIQVEVAEYQYQMESYSQGWPNVAEALNRLLELSKENP